MIIGTIGYLSEHRDEAYVRVISVNKFMEKFNFKPSNVNFDICLGKIICILEEENHLKFLKFEVELHQEFLDLEMIKNKFCGISIINNIDVCDFIIDNQIDDKQNPKLNELRFIKKKINFKSNFPSSKINYLNANEINDIIDEYQVSYSQSGYDKPGDYSRASIRVISTSSYTKLDTYLKKLLPDYSFTLGESEDCIEYPFKHNIIGKLRNEIGEYNIREIEKLCIDLTVTIRKLAKLIYNEKDHANELWHYCNRLKADVKNDYKRKIS